MSEMRCLVGQIPEPDELFGRSDFIDHLWRMLEANNVLLLAPRRFGKSGIMRHVLLEPRAGYLPLSFELEDVDSPEEFVWRVTKELLSHSKIRAFLRTVNKLPAMLTNWVKDTFEEAEFEGAKLKFKQSIREDWREAAKRMLLELEKADDSIIFLFDELPAMLDRIIERKGADEARDFLAWFRPIRIAQKDVLRRHRFIVAGSVGIDQILRKLDSADKLVDFTRLPVEPLDPDHAVALAEGLAKTFQLNWSEPLSNRLFELIGAEVPYFIHVFFSQLGQLPPRSKSVLTVADLDRIYKERLMGPTCRNYFDHYSTRLKRYGAAGQKAAQAILRTVAGQERISRPVLFDVFRRSYGKGATEQGFDDTMADLEYDWYLRLDPDTNEFYFRLKIMRDWWRRWYPHATNRAKPPAKKGKGFKTGGGPT